MSLFAVAACEEKAYPTPAESAPPPPAASELMGAPRTAAPSADIPSAAEEPPPGPSSADAAPPPPGAPSIADGPEDRPPVVAMAPIPNPGDPGSEGYYPQGRSRHHGRVHAGPAPERAFTPTSFRYRHWRRGRYQATAAATHRRRAPIGSAPRRALAARGSVPAASRHSAAPAPAVAANDAQGAPASALTSGSSEDRALRLHKFETALIDAVAAGGGVLTVPDRFAPNQPVDVSFALPAGFAKTTADEARRQGLSDEAASVNITAALSGDGFTVTPDESQAQPLAAGRPTQFHWTVTARPGAKGPLYAAVGADLLGGGSETLSLGSVRKATAPNADETPRVVGAALLVLLAALGLTWFARRRAPAGAVVVRRGSRRRADVEGRPFDMGDDRTA